MHEHCRGCGVLAGPDHEHRLRDGYCAELLVSVDHATGVAHLRPLLASCWDWQVRTRSAGGDGPPARFLSPDPDERNRGVGVCR